MKPLSGTSSMTWEHYILILRVSFLCVSKKRHLAFHLIFLEQMITFFSSDIRSTVIATAFPRSGPFLSKATPLLVLWFLLIVTHPDVCKTALHFLPHACYPPKASSPTPGVCAEKLSNSSQTQCLSQSPLHTRTPIHNISVSCLFSTEQLEWSIKNMNQHIHSPPGQNPPSSHLT